KGATFHHSPSASPVSPVTPPPLRRAHSNFDHVVDAHRRRVALALSNIDQSLAASAKDDSSSLSSSSAPGRSFRDDSLPIPHGFPPPARQPRPRRPEDPPAQARPPPLLVQQQQRQRPHQPQHPPPQQPRLRQRHRLVHSHLLPQAGRRCRRRRLRPPLPLPLP